ncbi:hypothetical protein ONZ45_g18637 [Pleurotus djamor]|nr:hypothetical protein ONZ45_g18637 [Pleurotus djamor]
MVHTSSAVVLGALALNAANAFATPVMNPINSEFQARDDNTNQLEERRIGSFLTKAAPFIPLLSMIPGLGGQQRRELIEELEARGTTTDKLKKFAPWAPLIPFALDFLKPAQPQQQAPPPPPPQRREIEEFLGREISDVEARGLGKFFTKVGPVLPFISMIPGLGGQQRRDVDEGLEERGFRNTFTKIAPWAPLIPIGLDLLKGGQQQQAPPPPPPQRRDIEEMLGRDLSDVEARGLSEILDTVSQVAPYLPMIGGMLPEKKPTIAPKPAHLRGKPKREISDDESLEARAFRSKFDKIAPWGPVIAIGADLIKQKISPPPPPPTFDPATMGAPPTARDVDDNEELEARAVKGGRGGGFGGALKKVGTGLEKAAPWVPLAVTLKMITKSRLAPSKVDEVEVSAGL